MAKFRVKNGLYKSGCNRFNLNRNHFGLNVNRYIPIIFTHRKAVPLGYKMNDYDGRIESKSTERLGKIDIP